MSTSLTGEIIYAIEEAPRSVCAASALGNDICNEGRYDAMRSREAVRDARTLSLRRQAIEPKVIRLRFAREEVVRGMRLPRDLGGQDLAQALSRLG